MSQQNKPDFYDPSTWSDELVLMEYNLAMQIWTELMFINPEDQLLPCPPEQALKSLAFWRSRLDLAEPEAKRRNLIS
jgi:hypothetical protein